MDHQERDLIFAGLLQTILGLAEKDSTGNQREIPLAHIFSEQAAASLLGLEQPSWYRRISMIYLDSETRGNGRNPLEAIRWMSTIP
jgi:hypothetical protein